jgi:hypothetical protein
MDKHNHANTYILQLQMLLSLFAGRVASLLCMSISIDNWTSIAISSFSEAKDYDDSSFQARHHDHMMDTSALTVQLDLKPRL